MSKPKRVTWEFATMFTDLEVSRICTALIRTGSEEDLTLATRIRFEHAEYTELKKGTK